MWRAVLRIVCLLLFAFPAIARPEHAFSLHGEIKYKPGFTHFDYVNPNAPKGGAVVMAGIGTFDNLHPFLLKGMAAEGLALTFDTLMTPSSDEASTQYGLIAKSIEVAEDKMSVIFALREEARFHDGSPVTAEDVVFTFNKLKEEGHPFYRAYYADVAGAEALDAHTVRFTFATDQNRELPLILGEMPVLSARFFESQPFNQTTLKPVMSSGPYRVTKADQGRSLTYERVADYWGKDLPVNRGRYNFDSVRYDFYRDPTIAFEAFKAEEYDFTRETIAKTWATAYDFPAVRQGRIIKEEIPHQVPTGMQAFFYNVRRPLFSDIRVREALTYAYDFEWANHALFNDAYTRTESYFSNSELASSGLPEGRELEILQNYKARVPKRVFTEIYAAPKTDGTGYIRANLLKARDLLSAAGWHIENGVLVNDRGEPFEFEILLVSSAFERVALPFVRNLKRLGIVASVRVVDAAQYQKRLESFDFDTTVISMPQSLSPGNEQRDFWGSYKADVQGSRNYSGIKDPVVDELIEQIINAPTRDELIYRTRALDRVLLAGHYVIPHWHIRHFRVAYKNRFGRPDILPPYALTFVTDWWVRPDAPAAASSPETEGDRGAGEENAGWFLLLLLAAGGLFFLHRRRQNRVK